MCERERVGAHKCIPSELASNLQQEREGELERTRESWRVCERERVRAGEIEREREQERESRRERAGEREKERESRR